MFANDLIRERINEAIAEHGLTARAWSMQAGLGPNFIQQFLDGAEIRSIRVDALEKLGIIVGWSASDFLKSSRFDHDSDFGRRREVEACAPTGFSEDGSQTIVDHRDLEVWKQAMSLVTAIYERTSKFPSEEKFGLISQLRRAAISIPTNIAEGHGRETSGAYVQFLRIAQGSAKEIETLIELSRRLTFLSPTDANDLHERTQTILKMLRGLIRAIERRRS